MELREYQTECIETIKTHFEEYDRQLIQLPTGSGKTFIFLKYLSMFSKRSLIIVPTKELCEQVEENSSFFFPKGVYRKKRNYMIEANHYVVTAQSLPYKFMRHWVKTQEFDHIVIDEAHRAYSKTYMDFIDHYRKCGYSPKIIGFTATPERYDKKSLLDVFEEITYQKTFYDLITEGYLCDVEGYRIKTKIDLHKSTRSPDFNATDLRKLDTDTRNNIILDTFRKKCSKVKTLIFCVTVDHARKLSTALLNEGYKAACVYGDMPFNQRKEILQKFKSGEIQVLCNCQLLTEGFDEPSIENLIIARPTQSKSLYCQMVGRCVRLFPGKKIARVYELTDNTHDICTFDVAAETESSGKYEYKDGQRLSQIYKELISLDLSEIDLEEEKFSFYEKKSDFFENLPPSEWQIYQLRKEGIQYMNPINFFQAGFLLWKQNLKRKYGFI